MSKIIQEIEKQRMTRAVPEFKPGDTVVVQVKVVEGDRERVHGAQDLPRRGRRTRLPDL